MNPLKCSNFHDIFMHNMCSQKTYMQLQDMISEELKFLYTDNSDEKIITYSVIKNLKNYAISCQMNVPLLHEKSDVTLVITSCDRMKNLAETFYSFFYFNNYPINKVVIIEDSSMVSIDKINDTVVQNLIPDVYLDIIINKFNIGQVRSVDKAYSEVNTKYIFHSEDDWEYVDSNFIERSRNIFEVEEHNKYTFNIFRPDRKKFLEGLIRQTDNLDYIFIKDSTIGLEYYKTTLSKNVSSHSWKGFSFNPGLRKLSDYITVGKYESFLGQEVHYESLVSSYYFKLGYIAFYIDTSKYKSDYIVHTGDDGHAHTKLPDKIKSFAFNIENVINYIILNYQTRYLVKDLLLLEPKIPYLTHNICLFSEKDFLFENDENNTIPVIANIIGKTEKNSMFSWQHYIWTDDTKKVDDYIKINSQFLSDKVITFNVSDIASIDLCNKIHSLSPVENVSICEVLSMHDLLLEYGGIYIGEQYQIERYPLELHGIFKFYMSTSLSSVLHRNFSGSVPHHPLHKIYQDMFLYLASSVERLDHNFSTKSLLSNITDNKAETIQTFFLSRTDIVYKYYLDLYGEEFTENDIYFVYEPWPCNNTLSDISICDGIYNDI